MLIQPSSSQSGLVGGTVVLLENSITVRITEQHRRMKPPFGVKQLELILITPCYSFPALYTPVSVLSCSGKTCSPMASFGQRYSRRSTAAETHTMKRTLHSPFTDCMSGTVIQLGGSLS
ncbi:hypothetical protein TNCV_4045731 [Trichonephila clavipes]|nr:hypothetical protein TNCV_4045731 [Trichonephila clavipes]